MTFSAIAWLFVSAVIGWATIQSPAQPRTLRVCADPDYLPYSNRAGQGFENKIAEAVAKALDATVEYTWAPSRRHGGFSEYLSATLDSKKCDVVMNIPYGSREELTTRPYYISSYVFVFKKIERYNITNMDSPALRQLKIGFESGTPPEDGLRMRGLLKRSVSFDIAENSEQSPASMLTALETGEIDVLITWEPAIGHFLKDRPELEALPVPNSRALGTPEQYTFPMSMGVRESDEKMQRLLDAVIAQHETELSSILQEHGVRLYELQPDQP
jgi:mxaJ protein